MAADIQNWIKCDVSTLCIHVSNFWEALCVNYSNHGVTCAYSLSVHSVHSMNMVESIFWNNEDWKGKPVGVVPRIHRQHQVGWSSLHMRTVKPG